MFTLKKSNRQKLVPLLTGDRTRIKLLNNVQTQYLNLRAKARVAIATNPATAIRNRGSVFALYSEMGIEENGTVKWLDDPRILKHVSESAMPSPSTATRLTSTAVATTTLVETMRVPFAHPYAVAPHETSYMERDPKANLEFFATLNVAGGAPNAAALLSVGTAVVTIDQVEITVQQGFDQDEPNLPYLLPTSRKIVTPISSSATDLEVLIKTSNRLRGLTISQYDNTVGEVTDVINTVRLRGDRQFIIGPEEMPWDDLAREQEYEFGGDVYSTAKGSHVHLNFQQFGRLSRVLNPVKQDINLRFLFNCQPTVVSGATGSQIAVTLWELEHDLFVDSASGRRINAPTLPFDA